LNRISQGLSLAGFDVVHDGGDPPPYDELSDSSHRYTSNTFEMLPDDRKNELAFQRLYDGDGEVFTGSKIPPGWRR
jgi:hypothetical protein